LKKILTIGLILAITLPVTVFAVEEYVNLGPVRLQAGINQFPGKNYWIEEMHKWDGSDWQTKWSQNEESFHVTLLSVRASKMKPILTPSLSGGLEVGCEIPIISWKKDWKNPAGDIGAVPPEVTEYTVLWFEVFQDTTPAADYSQLFELKETFVVVPVLGKLAYNTGRRAKVGVGLSFGAYIVNSRIIGTTTHTYAQNSPPYVQGEKETTEMSISATTCSPGGEFSVQLSLPLGNQASIGLNGYLGYIGKATVFWGLERTGYTQIEWSPAAPEMATLKQIFEVGGLSYGGGLSLNFFL